MKRLLTIFLLVGLISSCSTNRYILSDQEYENSPFCVNGSEVCYNLNDSTQIKIGYIKSIEHEIYEGKLTKEISVMITNLQYYNEDLMKYLQTHDKNAKIEIQSDKYE